MQGPNSFDNNEEPFKPDFIASETDIDKLVGHMLKEFPGITEKIKDITDSDSDTTTKYKKLVELDDLTWAKKCRALETTRPEEISPWPNTNVTKKDSKIRPYDQESDRIERRFRRLNSIAVGTSIGVMSIILGNQGDIYYSQEDFLRSVRFMFLGAIVVGAYKVGKNAR